MRDFLLFDELEDVGLAMEMKGLIRNFELPPVGTDEEKGVWHINLWVLSTVAFPWAADLIRDIRTA